VGIGPGHAAKEGLVLGSVMGFALLAVGAALALWAAGGLLRRLRRRWWLVAVPLMLLAIYLSLWTVGQAVAADFPARPALGARTPADVGLDYREVTFPAEDGVTLAGWYAPAGDGAAVALLHGAGSTRSAVLDHAAVLAGHGYAVLLLDARGHGESDGAGMDFGWYGERDAGGAVGFLTRQPGVDPERIALVGLSMGGEEAIGAAGVDDRVAAVVAEGATNRVAEDKGYLAAYGARGGLQQRIDAVTYAVAGLLTDAPRPASLRDSVAAAASRPDPATFLLVTAGDVETERLAADYIRGAAPEAVLVWTVPGAGHTAGLRVAPEEWERRVAGFLDDALAP
jgi:dienelactone hydrolase